MFTTVTESADVDPQSRYGEPQHEEKRWSGWESEYYGNGGDQGALVDIEFVIGIEYSAPSDAETASSTRRRTQPLLIG